jgi:hypothetical protein
VGVWRRGLPEFQAACLDAALVAAHTLGHLQSLAVSNAAAQHTSWDVSCARVCGRASLPLSLLRSQVDKQCKCLINLANLYELQVSTCSWTVNGQEGPTHDSTHGFPAWVRPCFPPLTFPPPLPTRLLHPIHSTRSSAQTAGRRRRSSGSTCTRSRQRRQGGTRHRRV